MVARVRFNAYSMWDRGGVGGKYLLLAAKISIYIYIFRRLALQIHMPRSLSIRIPIQKATQTYHKITQTIRIFL
jgi:hypothetical protein